MISRVHSSSAFDSASTVYPGPSVSSCRMATGHLASVSLRVRQRHLSFRHPGRMEFNERSGSRVWGNSVGAMGRPAAPREAVAPAEDGNWQVARLLARG